jgi:ABC-type multidrug transport system permease subunit
MAERRHPFVELTLARTREFLREPEAIFWVFVFPVLLSLALGLAFRNRGEERVRIGVLDVGVEAAVERTVTALEADDGIRPVRLDEARAEAELRSGGISVLVVPRTDEVVAEGLAPYAFRFDPTRTESRYARILAKNALERDAGRVDRVRADEETVSKIGRRYIDFLIPGLLGMNLMGSGMWGIGFAIVQMRQKKLLKRFVATPMRKWHFLLSLFVSRMVFLIPEMAAIIGAGVLIFGVPVRGSLVTLLVLSFFGSLVFCGIGALCASRVKTVEGASGLLNLVMMPMWLFSGVFFSIENFPEIMHPVLRALPLTVVNDILRAVMLDGATFLDVLPQLGFAILWGIIPLVVALRIFRWT